MISSHRARLLLGAAALAGIGLPAGALANTLDVIATVAEACTVIPGVLDFGEYTPGQPGDTSASGSFDVDCTVPADVDIALDAGEHVGQGGNGFRAMSNAGGTDFLFV
jgi:spore coat protein U-like protein